MEGLLYRYLVRRTSGAEDREVYAWLEASEKNRSLFFEVAAVWSAHRTLISPATGERCDAMLRRLNARIDADDAMQRPARFAWRRWMSAAAAAGGGGDCPRKGGGVSRLPRFPPSSDAA